MVFEISLVLLSHGHSGIWSELEWFTFHAILGSKLGRFLVLLLSGAVMTGLAKNIYLPIDFPPKQDGRLQI